MFSLIFPAIDPVLVHVGPVAIRWYALAYIGGILFGWYYLGKLNRKPGTEPVLSEKAFDDIVIWAVFGILLGGRLGYILFYNSGYYLTNPAEAVAVWKGGMSFHGGLIGVITAMYLFTRVYKIHFFRLMDMMACVTPIGLFFGRCANFVNGELYGRIAPASLPWGVVFPNDPFPRHPSQFYEAGLEGIALFFILMFLAYRTDARSKPGVLSGVFLACYALFRSFVEFFREPDPQIGMLLGTFTMGQVLCVPMFLLGLFLIERGYRKKHDAA